MIHYLTDPEEYVKKRRKRFRKWYRKHRTKERARTKKYCEENKEKRNKYFRIKRIKKNEHNNQQKEYLHMERMLQTSMMEWKL